MRTAISGGLGLFEEIGDVAQLVQEHHRLDSRRAELLDILRDVHDYYNNSFDATDCDSIQLYQMLRNEQFSVFYQAVCSCLSNHNNLQHVLHLPVRLLNGNLPVRLWQSSCAASQWQSSCAASQWQSSCAASQSFCDLCCFQADCGNRRFFKGKT